MPTIFFVPYKSEGPVAPPKSGTITTNHYPCEECGKIFANKKNFSAHLKHVHRRENTSDCKECGKVFSNNAILQRHITTVHKGIITYFQCDICGERFVSKNSMERHRNALHLKQFIVMCDICGKGFMYKSELKLHVQKTHKKDERPLVVCPELDCGKVFRTHSNLKYHQDAEHTENKPELKCNQCGKTFNHSGSYRNHVWNHKRGPQIFPCIVCEKTVTSKRSLEAHMRIHTGEKPYVCEHCGKAFTKACLLKIHLVVHTKEKPFACTLCDKKYTQRGPLTGHIRRCHRNNM